MNRRDGLETRGPGRPKATEPCRYLHVADDLRREILAGCLQAGDQLLTEPKLAARYGVSVVTVRQGVQLLVDEGLVRKEHGRGTFVTEAAGKHRRLLLVCGLSAVESEMPGGGIGPYHQDCIRFCLEAAAERGFEVETFWPNAPTHGAPTTPEEVALNAFSGVIFLACPDNNPLVQRARREGLHTVLLGKTRKEERAVWFDLWQSAEVAREQHGGVLVHGRHTVVVASVYGETRGAEALANWAPGRLLHVQLPAHLSLRDVERYGYQAIRELCEEKHKRPLAFVFLDDVLARGGTRALLQTGFGDGRCPVVVVTGKQEIEPYGLPVTYITHDTEQEARWAVEMLEAQIQGEPEGTEPRQSLFEVGEAEIARRPLMKDLEGMRRCGS